MFEFFKKTKNTDLQPEEVYAPRKAIIDGKLYDTGTATKICSFEVPEHFINLKSGYFAILFVTQKGNFFVQQFGELYSINRENARGILEQNPDKYIEVFGEVEEA